MEDTFESVYRAYGSKVFAYLARLTGDRPLAEELCQETFLRYLRHRADIRNENGALAPWLYRVATRLVLDSRRRPHPVRLTREPLAPSSGDDPAEHREIAARAREEIGRLPPELRATFLLRAHEELTFPQIAEATNVSERAAKNRFRRARDILLRRLAPLVRENRS